MKGKIPNFVKNYNSTKIGFNQTRGRINRNRWIENFI